MGPWGCHDAFMGVDSKKVGISPTPGHDHHEMYLISVLTALNLISVLSCSSYAICGVRPRAVHCGGRNYSESCFQVSTAQSWIQKRASSVAFAVCRRRFVRWQTSDAKPHLLRPLARTPRARSWPSGVRKCGKQNGTALTSSYECQSLLSGHVHVLISEEWKGTSVRHPPRWGT